MKTDRRKPYMYVRTPSGKHRCWGEVYTTEGLKFFLYRKGGIWYTAHYMTGLQVMQCVGRDRDHTIQRINDLMGYMRDSNLTPLRSFRFVIQEINQEYKKYKDLYQLDPRWRI